MVSVVEYIWLGGNSELRSKTRVLDITVNKLSDIPDWNYDGSSTNQATGNDSEVIIKPQAMFDDPLRSSSYKHCCKLVLCDTYSPTGEALDNNYRKGTQNIFEQDLTAEPWFGLEQEYFMIDSYNKQPLGFPTDITHGEQGQYYCSIGAENAFGRNIVEEHLTACLKAGIKISGINAEVAPGQWEFQIGPCEGIQAGDHLWVARYLLIRIAEKYNIQIDFEPKPVKGNWNGSGCHTNFSTKNMREGVVEKKDCSSAEVRDSTGKKTQGIDYINKAIEKLSAKHKEHMEIYGKNNEERMTGEHETAAYNVFNSGIANRGASIRIGNETTNNKQGYFEDRRPSSNCDPYRVTGIIFETTVL